MHNFCEVAPTPLISCQRTSSNPKLETIFEEGSQNSEVVPKRVLFLLPVVLSVVLYFLLYRDVALMGRVNA